MGLAYLNVEPEEALQLISDHIVAGYQTKDKILDEYLENQENCEGLLPKWEAESIEWANQTLNMLGVIFYSKKESYNFRDVSVSSLGRIGWNVYLNAIMNQMQARINQLNKYDSDIRSNFNVNLEVVIGDKITQTGNGKNVIKKQH